MINYDDSEQNILSFYNISTVNARSKDQFDISNHGNNNAEEISDLTTDEQFDLLNKLVNTTTDLNNNPQNDYNDEDYEDSLRGRGTNVVKELISKGIISSTSDPQISQYLISSQNFNSQQFLTNVHQDTSIDDLIKSLGFLERNIQSQTNELKSAIDDNFINFVNCKKSIDDVLIMFKKSKTRAQQERENNKVFNPQRHNKISNKQETLSSDLEELIKNLNITSSLMIRPIMEHKNREHKINKLIEFVKGHRFFFDAANDLIKHISNHDHDSFIDTYHRLLKEKEEFLTQQEHKYNAEISKLDQEKDQQVIKNLEQEKSLIITALSKVFIEVDNIIGEYRKKTYKELITMDHEVSNSKFRSGNNNNAKFIALVDKLYQLDKNTNGNNNGSNPIFDFLNVQLDGLQKDLDYQTKKFDNKFTMMQRKLADYINSLNENRKNGSDIRFIDEKYNSIEDYFRASSTSSIPSIEEKERIIMEVFDLSDNLDLPIISETWLVLNNFINYLNDLFLKSLNKFVNNYNHYCKPDNGFNIDSNGKIRDKFIKLIEQISMILVTLFNDDSGEVNQLESSPNNYTQFLPYHTNSLSAVFYLTNINSQINLFLTKLGEFVGIIGNLNKSLDTNKLIKNLRNSSSKINQKIIEAVCSVWVNDCSQFYDLENWEIYDYGLPFNDKQVTEATYTKTMKIIEYFEIYILTKLSNLVFISDSIKGSEIRIIASYPSKRTLVSIEIQFMRSLNVLIDSMMKRYNIERTNKDMQYEFELFKILTMNNFDELSRIIYPNLILKFDKLFDKDLSRQNLKLFEDIDKVNETIFQDILSREKSWINNKLNKFFSKTPKIEIKQNILKIDGVVYEVLIHFVKLIHIVKPLTSLEIFIEVLNDLQECFLRDFLTNLRNLLNSNFFNGWLSKFKLDISFFMEVFESSKHLKLNEKSLNIVNLILKLINENEESNISESEFESILLQNLKDSENEFDCF